MKKSKPSGPNPPGTTDPASNQQERWNRACTDLKSALTSWDELASAPKRLSKDEQQLEEVKRLLKDLAKQVADLS
jgi:hypothetical protein